MVTPLPSISYGIGYLDDFTALPPGFDSSADPLTELAEEIIYDDWMRIYGVPNSANDEWRRRYTVDLTSLALGTTLYKKWRCRYRTESVTTGLAAKILVEYTAASGGGVDVLLPESFSGGSIFTVVNGTIPTSGRTIKYIYYYLDDYPNVIAATGQNVYYDFFMLYKDDFTLPNVAHGASFTPPPRYADQGAPSRVTDITQGMGAENASFDCSSDLDVGTWKRALDVVDAQVIYEIAHELSTTVDFVWLDTGEEQFKATMRRPVIHRYSDRRTLDLEFKEYSRCNASHYGYIERFGLNL